MSKALSIALGQVKPHVDLPNGLKPTRSRDWYGECSKEVEKSTKATEDQLKKRETGNARLSVAVNKTRKEFNKSVTAASKFKDQTVQGAKEAAAKVEHLNKKLIRTTEALRKGRKEAKDFFSKRILSKRALGTHQVWIHGAKFRSHLY